jgi:hypothetical protein
MTSCISSYSQIGPRIPYFSTIINTVWIYPPSDVDIALSNTTYSYTFDGTILRVPDTAALIGVYTDIVNQTLTSQPIGNAGFSLGVGTLLEDLGKDLHMVLPNGSVVYTWRLVRQISPQEVPYVSVPGNSPRNTIGYLPVYTAYGKSIPTPDLDLINVIRIG